MSAELLSLARHAVDEASGLLMRWFQSADLVVEHKRDGSPVTPVDRAAEEKIREILEREVPEDGIVGEELGDKASRSGRTWFVDPIDGTTSFVRGIPLFSTLLAAADRDGPLVGVIAAPALDEIAYATRDGGCIANGSPAHVSNASRLEGATVVTSGLGDYWEASALERLLRSGARVRTWADGGYGYILVASGRVDAMVDGVVKEWDVAPARCIVAEAGGLATNVRFLDRQGFAAGSRQMVEPLISELTSAR